MSNFETLQPGWYLLKSKVREELRAVVNLENQGFESWCPMLIEKSRGNPLFPGYLFIRIGQDDLGRYHKIRSTRGVTTVVTFNQMNRKLYSEGRIQFSSRKEFQQSLPQPIPGGDKIIEQIEDILWKIGGGKPEPKPSSCQFREGDPVCYNNPLFAHLKTTFVKGTKVDRGLILIEFIKSQRAGDEVQEKVTAEKRIEVPLTDLKKT